MRASTTIEGPAGVLLAFPPKVRSPLPPPSARSSVRVPVAIALVLTLAGLIVAITQTFKARAIRGVPSDVRARVFQEHLTEVRSTCLEGYAARGPLRDLCLEEARLILLFPECGSECRAAANAVLPHAHR